MLEVDLLTLKSPDYYEVLILPNLADISDFKNSIVCLFSSFYPIKPKFFKLTFEVFFSSEIELF
jgi:hypothetical protein